MDCCCKDAKITLDELKKHDASSNNMWIAIHGNVYDVTKFCNEVYISLSLVVIAFHNLIDHKFSYH